MSEQHIATVDQGADVQGYIYYSKSTGQVLAVVPGIGPEVRYPANLVIGRRVAKTPLGYVTSLRK